jgi:hypothetical protein
MSSPAQAGDPVNAGDYWILAFAGMTTSIGEALSAAINA